VYVNVHVGGVLQSADGGTSWRPLLDIEHDVHQALAPAARPGLVLVAAYDGFGVSEDRGLVRKPGTPERAGLGCP
jgi:hypothetical protein